MTLKAKRPEITALRKMFISDKKCHFDTISIASSDRVTKRKSFAQRYRNINFPPTEVREGNVFSHVFNFLQEKSFLVLITGIHCRGSQSPLCRGPPLYGVLPPPLELVQTCSLCRTDCQKAGGWHLTEMPSCFLHLLLVSFLLVDLEFRLDEIVPLLASSTPIIYHYKINAFI